jgi:hypothetical protein
VGSGAEAVQQLRDIVLGVADAARSSLAAHTEADREEEEEI